MRIGIVTTWFERGAAYVSRQYRDILEKQHEVFIYARGGESYAIGNPLWDNEGVTWGKRGKVPVPHTIDLDDFESWIKDRRIEIVFFNEQQWWEPILLCNSLGVITGGYVDYYTEETIPLFGCYDFLVCNTKRHYSVFDWHPQSCYIPWGTDINLFAPRSTDLVTPGYVTFFHSGGVSPGRKGTDLVIQAFAGLEGPARLVVHAQRILKDYFPHLREIITDLENSGRLVCHEKTVPAPGLYHMGDVYVYPSRLDGIGLTVAEALACGLPVITSDSPPMNEFIEGENGTLAAVSRLFARADGYYWPQCMVDLEDLRSCMQYYIDHIDRISEFKQKARVYADLKLDWSKNAADLSGFFERVKKLPDGDKLNAQQLAQAYENKRLSYLQRPQEPSPKISLVTRISAYIAKRLGLISTNLNDGRGK